jgi:hypothetical protein
VALSQAALLSVPEIEPAFGKFRSCWFSLAAISTAWSAWREPRVMDSPALAQRRARPEPSGPVPPIIAMLMMGAHFDCDISLQESLEKTATIAN